MIREGTKTNGQLHGQLIARPADGTIEDISECLDGTGSYKIHNYYDEWMDDIPLRHSKPHGSARRQVTREAR